MAYTCVPHEGATNWHRQTSCGRKVYVPRFLHLLCEMEQEGGKSVHFALSPTLLGVLIGPRANNYWSHMRIDNKKRMYYSLNLPITLEDTITSVTVCQQPQLKSRIQQYHCSSSISYKALIEHCDLHED